MSKEVPSTDQKFIYKGMRNPFLLVMNEADVLIEVAEESFQENLDRSLCLSRSAVRSLSLAVEALVNLAMTHFHVPAVSSNIINDIQEKMNVVQKYKLLHLFCGLDEQVKIQLDRYPFTLLQEIRKVRNALSHPQANSPIYLCLDNFFNLSQVPNDVNSKYENIDNDETYGNTRIPRDLARCEVECAMSLRKVVKEIEARLIDIFKVRASHKGCSEWTRNEVFNLQDVIEER